MGSTVARRGLGVETAVLGMAVFLMVEAMFFAGLVSALVVGRFASKAWPPPGQVKASPLVAAAATLLLLASIRAMQAARREAAPVTRSLGWAALLGGAFLALVGWEGFRVLTGGSGLVANTYAGLLLMLLGCHALHVLGGVALIARARRLWRREEPAAAKSTRLRVCGMYWMFVVGVWPVIAVAVCV